MKAFLTASVVVALLTPRAASAQLANTKSLTLDAVKAMAAAGEAHARSNGWNVCIAIVDAGGHLLYFQRMDGTILGSIDISQNKARTAVLFRTSTGGLDTAVAGGRTQILAVEDMLPLQGGVPIVVDGQVVGAVGASGVTGAQDAEVARAAVAALKP